MDRSKADAIAQALLEPDLKAQEEFARKRAQAKARLAIQRRHAWFVLVGFTAGVAVGLLAGVRITYSGLVGAFAGMLASASVGVFSKRGRT